MDDEIFRFQREAYPHRDPDLLMPRWKWMFLESARRLGVEPMVWMYRKQEQIVAHQGAVAVRFQLAAEQFTTGWFVETMALESRRGTAIGPMVVQKALEDLPLNLSLGQTEGMRKLQFALGWRHVAPLPTYVLSINPAAMLQGKLPSAIVRHLAAAALLGRQKAAGVFRRPRDARGAGVRRVERFDASHDALWSEIKEGYPCAVVRDASFLNWKFVDQPGQNFVRLELCRDGRPLALAVISIREPDDSYRYRRAWLVDLVAPVDDDATVWQLFDAVRDTSQRLGADAIVLDLCHHKLERIVAQYGFVRRPSERVLLLATGGLDAVQTQQILHPENWLLTKADSDIDRPW